MRLAWIFALALAVAVPARAEPGKDLEKIVQKITVVTSADGSRVASSSPLAETKPFSRFANGGHGSLTVFAFARKREGAPTAVSLLATRIDPIFRTEVQNFDGANAPAPSGKGVVGDPWRDVPFKLIEHTIKCGASSAQMCMRTRAYQFDLSVADVQALLAAKQKGVRLSTDSIHTEWTLPADHLAATLEALGVLAEFH
jgi:hypothetical protein